MGTPNYLIELLYRCRLSSGIGRPRDARELEPPERIGEPTGHVVPSRRPWRCGDPRNRPLCPCDTTSKRGVTCSTDRDSRSLLVLAAVHLVYLVVPRP